MEQQNILFHFKVMAFKNSYRVAKLYQFINIFSIQYHSFQNYLNIIVLIIQNVLFHVKVMVFNSSYRVAKLYQFWNIYSIQYHSFRNIFFMIGFHDRLLFNTVKDNCEKLFFGSWFYLRLLNYDKIMKPPLISINNQLVFYPRCKKKRNLTIIIHHNSQIKYDKSLN